MAGAMKGVLLRLARAVTLGWAGTQCRCRHRHVQPGQDLQPPCAAAAPGDVIEVQRGNYRVNLLIDKPSRCAASTAPRSAAG
jgi:nitrous oxidase accessory protein